MVTKWIPKELLTAIKMNNTTNRRMTVAEMVASLDAERLKGDVIINSDNSALNIYQSGSGATFKVTEMTNFLFGNKTQIGITTPKKTIYNEPFVNIRGLMNTFVFVSLEYLQETSIAGEVEVAVTDGITPVTITDTLASNPSPTVQYKTYVLDTSNFAINKVLNVKVSLTQVQMQYVEFRGI